MSANQQNYSLRVIEITCDQAGNTRYTAAPGQQAMAFQWITGTTLAWFGGSSLAAGGSFGLVVPSSATASIANMVNMPNYRGDLYFRGGGATAAPTTIRIMEFFSATDV